MTLQELIDLLEVSPNWKTPPPENYYRYINTIQLELFRHIYKKDEVNFLNREDFITTVETYEEFDLPANYYDIGTRGVDNVRLAHKELEIRGGLHRLNEDGTIYETIKMAGIGQNGFHINDVTEKISVRGQSNGLTLSFYYIAKPATIVDTTNDVPFFSIKDEDLVTEWYMNMMIFKNADFIQIDEYTKERYREDSKNILQKILNNFRNGFKVITTKA